MAVIASSLFVGIAFLNTAKSSSVVFGYFVSLTTVLGAVNWANVLLSYFNFQRGLRAQGLTRSALPWKCPFQPYGAYYSAVVTILILLTSGWQAFVPKFDAATFVVAYVGIAVWVMNILGFKYWKNTKYVTPRSMDLQTNILTVAHADTSELIAEQTILERIKSALFGQ